MNEHFVIKEKIDQLVEKIEGFEDASAQLKKTRASVESVIKEQKELSGSFIEILKDCSIYISNLSEKVNENVIENFNNKLQISKEIIDESIEKNQNIASALMESIEQNKTVNEKLVEDINNLAIYQKETLISLTNAIDSYNEKLSSMIISKINEIELRQSKQNKRLMFLFGVITFLLVLIIVLTFII